MTLKRRNFIKTGLLFIPATLARSQDYVFFLSKDVSSGGCDLSGVDSNVVNWVNRVATNGGASLSCNTIYSMDTFYKGIVSNSLLSKMNSVCCFVPDNLIASITPLIASDAGAGIVDPWTNVGGKFVSADLTINGLKGNGTDKILATGVNPNSSLSINSAGLTIYNSSDNSNLPEYDMSITDTGGIAFSLLHSYSGTDYFDCYNSVAGRVSGVNSAFLGYVSGNRTASNATAIYKANSVTPHTTVASASGSPGAARPGFQIACFGTFSGAIVGTSPSSKRLSFAAVHSGLTSGESSTFYTLIQALRTSLGGGYV